MLRRTEVLDALASIKKSRSQELLREARERIDYLDRLHEPEKPRTYQICEQGRGLVVKVNFGGKWGKVCERAMLLLQKTVTDLRRQLPGGAKGIEDVTISMNNGRLFISIVLTKSAWKLDRRGASPFLELAFVIGRKLKKLGFRTS